ncbi:class I SAM-dependent methyltransferase [Inhella sp.]|uniref:class I SAM-dependent methyltransferase n=1 Tax=Inhella sp. TaxID=1921806 RepID=UPI0035B0CC31
MHAYYASRAPYYDAVYAKPERAADIAWLQQRLPEVFAGREVLELACGTGFWTPWIARSARRLVATDGTAEPLSLARTRPGCETVHFQQADAYALPAELQGFDAAFAGLWFSHVPRERQAGFLAGLHACLQPGACVVMIDNNEVQLRDFPIAETDAQGNTWQHRATRDGVTHRVLKNFPSEAEWRALLAGRATDIEWRMLENFWWVSYRLS